MCGGVLVVGIGQLIIVAAVVVVSRGVGGATAAALSSCFRVIAGSTLTIVRGGASGTRFSSVGVVAVCVGCVGGGAPVVRGVVGGRCHARYATWRSYRSVVAHTVDAAPQFLRGEVCVVDCVPVKILLRTSLRYGVGA